MSWLDRPFRLRPAPAGEPDLAELVTTVEPVVRAYAEVVAGSDSYVYRESELVHSKEKIRAALRVWAVCEPDPDARRELRMLYGLLEDFLPEGEWRLLERWHRAAKRHDYQGLRHAGRQATELLQTLAERRQRREEEFEEYLTRGGGPVLDGLGDPPPTGWVGVVAAPISVEPRMSKPGGSAPVQLRSIPAVRRPPLGRPPPSDVAHRLGAGRHRQAPVLRRTP